MRNLEFSNLYLFFNELSLLEDKSLRLRLCVPNLHYIEAGPKIQIINLCGYPLALLKITTIMKLRLVSLPIFCSII